MKSSGPALGVADGAQAYDADLAAVAALSTTGLVARTGAGTSATRTVASADGQITVANGDGVSGNPTLTHAYSSALRTTTGPTTLTMGAVADGALLARSGSTIAGSSLPTTLGKLWAVDMPPSGIVNGYERGAGTAGLSTWNPAGTTVVEEIAYGLKIYDTAVNANGGVYWPAPAATQWSITTQAVCDAKNISVRVAGIFVSENIASAPTTANLVRFILELDGTAEPNIKVQTWSAYNTFTATTFSITTGVGYRGSVFMRVSSDGTNWHLSISTDGIGWVEVATSTFATLATVNYIGVIAGAETTAEPAVYPWVRIRSGASEYRKPHIEGGVIV